MIFKVCYNICMRIFQKFFFIFLSLSLLLSINPVYAADAKPSNQSQFSTSYDVAYDVGEDGITTVTEKVNLRNLTSQYYASEFKLIIGATQIYDLKASDPSGPMQVSEQQTGTSTTLSVKFNVQMVGQNKLLPWTLSFKSKDFAEKTGKVWEIRAPKVSSDNLESYNLTVSVPVEFGEPSLITPSPKTQTIAGDRMFLTFDKAQLQQAGVSASFGTFQLFDYDLSYHLENTNLFPVLTNIALPPDTAYQDVIISRIDPKPENVTVDDDGNYLAWYRLKRGEKLDVKVIGSAKLYNTSKAKNPLLPDSLRQVYTNSDKYWEKDNPQIQATLAEILGPNPPQNPTEKIRLIYHYVVNNLRYDPARINDNIERLGAVAILNNPTQAVCMEFTDLFIALSRAAGIPARELDGFAYTANTTLRPLSLAKDVLHAWPEYWDETRGWVMVDPTWENTTGGVDYFDKLDLNHFTFAIKGRSSASPIPAGSYKYTGQNSQDVKVQLSDNDFLGKPQLGVQIENSSPIWAGFPGKVAVNISNVGNAVYPQDSLSVTAAKLIVLGGETQNMGPVAPFGAASFDFNVRTRSLFDSFSDQIVVTIGNKKYTKDVEIKPFLIFQTVPMIAIGIISLMGITYLVILGGLIYRRRFLKAKK